ncbi:substrate-binding domain-containing protein [Silvibacterium sp.]|uniref:substrate-binding domain-containing protein n=1 Tax=Silvibacterium sp. TaxID=1964179 RepID=UPI0039E31DFC
MMFTLRQRWPGRASFLFLAGALTPLAGCRAHPMRVAVIPQTTAVTIWEAEHAGAEFAANHFGFKVYWNAPTSEDDTQQQAELIDRVVKQKYSAMILAPDQAVAMMAPVQRAIEKGVRTVIVAAPLNLPPGPNLTYIVNDDLASGRIAAMRMGQILNGHGRIAILGVPPQSLSTLAMVHSFETTLEKNFPGISVTERRFGTHNLTGAEQIAEDALDEDPQLDGLFTVSSAATGGAYEALRAHGLLGKVKVVGFEQSVELANLLRNGSIDSLVAINTYEMGYRAMESLAAPPGSQPSEILLQPTLLTSANLDSAEARPLMSVDWSREP